MPPRVTLRRSCLLLIAALLAAPCLTLPVRAAPAGAIVEPPPGSPDRRAIMDLLRVPMVEAFGAPIEFRVDGLKMVGDHAFARVHPQRPGGRPIKITFPCEVEGKDLDVQALLVRRGGRWAFDTPKDGHPELCADDFFDWGPVLKARGLPPQMIGRDRYELD